ncbi:hypothetical protein E2C01_023146 [Portunus trituberculatus]|uniref:Uncharacterized protein n=1 Tax=Portunus trituberculatus TaxID=210409 RepID=A0A5B7E977_PORTR|nr:hypothetical protein [Portunus trituberculatus]
MTSCDKFSGRDSAVCRRKTVIEGIKCKVLHLPGSFTLQFRLLLAVLRLSVPSSARCYEHEPIKLTSRREHHPHLRPSVCTFSCESQASRSRSSRSEADVPSTNAEGRVTLISSARRDEWHCGGWNVPWLRGEGSRVRQMREVCNVLSVCSVNVS